MLDYNGNIWYWGNKDAVGIEDAEHENQKTPKILLSAVEEGPFIYISTNHSKNLAVTHGGYVIGFGHFDGKDTVKVGLDNKEDKNLITSKSGCKWKLIKSEDDVVNTLYVVAGFTHNILVTEKGYPYSWGNNINGRCGVSSNVAQTDVVIGKRKDSDSDEDANANNTNSEGLYIDQPQNIKLLRRLFKRNVRDNKNALEVHVHHNNKDVENDEAPEDSDDDMKIKNLKFNVQEQLKETKLTLSEESLYNKDLSLKFKLRVIVQRIHESMKHLQSMYNKQFFNTESSLISGIYNFQK